MNSGPVKETLQLLMLSRDHGEQEQYSEQVASGLQSCSAGSCDSCRGFKRQNFKGESLFVLVDSNRFLIM